MADRRNLPHVLIDAIPELTERLLRSDETTFVWSSNPILKGVPIWSFIKRIHQRTESHFDEDEDLDETSSNNLGLVWQLEMTGLIFEALKLGKPPIENMVEDLRKKVAGIHEYFKLEFDEPVRIACVGSHGPLWDHEHANVGQRNSDIVHYLEKAAKKRQFVADLHSALSQTPGVELEWLAQGCPVLREERERHWSTSLPPAYKKVADLARRHLKEKPRLASIRGCIPLLYTESDGEWQLYGDGDRGPSRRTKRLLEQYSSSRASLAGEHTVLVKLLPDDRAVHNPCDNPIVDTGQLKLALESGVRAVLLDSEQGIVHHKDIKVQPGLPQIYAA